MSKFVKVWCSKIDIWILCGCLIPLKWKQLKLVQCTFVPFHYEIDSHQEISSSFSTLHCTALVLYSRELVLHGAVLLLLDAVLVVAGQHPPVLLPVVDWPRPGLHPALQLHRLALRHQRLDICDINLLCVNICLCSPRSTHLVGCTWTNNQQDKCYKVLQSFQSVLLANHRANQPAMCIIVLSYFFLPDKHSFTL